jgi:phage terminase large subunit
LNAKQINNEQQLLEFAQQIQFPSHAIILKDREKMRARYTKEFKMRFYYSKYRQLKPISATLTPTDMRASYNPTRMNNVIAKAVET